MSNWAMNNETDLDWLARNVHKWPFNIFDAKPTEKYVWNQSREGGDIIVIFRDSPSVFTRDQWLARRAELQNNPSFADHPDAKCFVQNDSGTWFKNRNSTNVIPESDGGWFDRDMSCGWTQLGAGEVLGDWRDTLEKRPSDLSEQMVMSRLQEATDNVLAAAPELMTDKYKFEPFVSVEDAATAKQPAPKGSGSPILGMVLADLTNRALEGKEKYGEPLLAHNGRNPLWDAYQEALDLAMYLRQAIEELG